MIKAHVTDFYMDGHVTVPFCKVCSAEGDMLLDECVGIPFVRVPDNKQKILDDERDFIESLLTR